MNEFYPKGYQHLSAEEQVQMSKIVIPTDLTQVFHDFVIKILNDFIQRIKIEPNHIKAISYLRKTLGCSLQEAHQLGSALIVAMPSVLYPKGWNSPQPQIEFISERIPNIYSFILNQQMNIGEKLIEDAVVFVVQKKTAQQEGMERLSRLTQ